MTEIIIPEDSLLYQLLYETTLNRRIVLFAGLPGVGKSLFLQQLALMAHQVGRVIHLLQWDVTRNVFETDALLAKYPEIDGVTHAAIRKAVGLWTRQGVLAWHQHYADPKHLLIGEVPLIGNRLIELAQRQEDDAESLLRGEQTHFLIPVPSAAVRREIESARQKTLTSPQHERETVDAMPNVMQLLWDELYSLARQMGIVTVQNAAYDPNIYARVYLHLLRHRYAERLDIDHVLSVTASVYDLHVIESELAATPEQVEHFMAQVENTFSKSELEKAVAEWYRV
ncbi:MAG TPA: hypothetical protein VJZ27_04385 [Aggregatilineales bacterium]|nr:hypothetical protein [Aggregatilineales bacterium]